MMTEGELRELDAKVHLALYPDDKVERGGETWARRGHGRLSSFFVLKSSKYVPIPHYTTNIGAWGPVYALKPEWRWYHECVDDDGERYEAVCLSVFDGKYTCDYVAEVRAPEASGLAAYALGRSRCVIAWAEAQR